MAEVQFYCEVCHQVITEKPWKMPCLHLVCNQCAQHVAVHCHIDNMTTHSSELTKCTDLIVGLESIAKKVALAAAPCQHERRGLFPCCVRCGELMESLIVELQDWECEECKSMNNGERFICTFCCKTNEEQRRNLERRRRGQ